MKRAIFADTASVFTFTDLHGLIDYIPMGVLMIKEGGIAKVGGW